jgi:membrane protease YdiL (CAAX protease family)
VEHRTDLSNPKPTSSPPADAPLHVPWTRRDLILALVLGVVLSVGLTLLILLGTTLFARATGHRVPTQVTGVLSIVAEMSLLVPVWWFGLHRYRLGWSSIGFRDCNRLRALGLCCLFIISGYAANMVWGVLMALLRVQSQRDITSLFGRGWLGLALALLTGSIAAPIAEEAFFRGFVFAGLHRRIGLRRALWLSATVFALMHVQPSAMPPILVLGVLLASLYEQTGSLWPSILVHAFINTFSMLVLYAITLLPH